MTMPAPGTDRLGGWHRFGLCVGVDPEVFFPSHGDLGAQARKVCAACAVRDRCLSYATAADEFGIWGGLDRQERRNLKRRQHRRNAAAHARDSSAGGVA